MDGFEKQPVLESALVRLRPLRAEDWEALYGVAADRGLWAQHPCHDRWEEGVFRGFFDEAMASGGALLIADAATGEVIGSSRFHGYDAGGSGGVSEVEIGWTFLARSRWGGRWNGEVKRLMLGHAFRFVDSVVFKIGPENWRSRKAVEKIGGVFEGELDEAGRGVSVVYRLLKS